MAFVDDLQKVGTFLVTELAVDLARKQKKASGKLLKSLRSEVNAYPEGYEIAVMAESYFKFVDKGINGRNRGRNSPYSFKSKKPPIAPLIEWIKTRSIASGNREIRNIAFAIQNHIYRNGIKGINVLEETLKRASFQYINKIQDAVFIKVSIEIDNILKNGNNN